MPAKQAPPTAASGDGIHVVGDRNRWSRLVLAFERLAAGHWYEFSAYMICAPAETGAEARDFAALGVAFLAQDRSEIDFTRVPGLGRTSLDLHGDWIPGPAWGRPPGTRASPIRCAFFLPAPAAQVTVVIRSWRNACPFRVLDPALRQREADAPSPSAETSDGSWDRLCRDGRIGLGPQPHWFHYGLVPGRALVLKGQMIVQGAREQGARERGPLAQGGQAQGCLAQVRFRAADGSPIPPPYPDTLATLAIPAFLDIPVHREAYRFTCRVAPPPEAALLDLGFATWDPQARIALAAPPDLFLDEDLRLANLADDADSGPAPILARLLARLGLPRAGDPGGADGSIRPYLDPARLAEQPAPLRAFARLRDGADAAAWRDGMVRLESRPGWTLPEMPDWAADPFRSPAWRLAFQSLSWTCAAAESPQPAVRARAIAVALSWSRANPWGRPADPLSLHPACMALRLEAMLGLLGSVAREAGPADGSVLDILGGEITRHAVALAEILAQRTVAGSLLELQVASALLGVGLTLPSFPMARHWACLAASALDGGFAAMIDPDGALVEPSYHRGLEILTLALVLMPILRTRPDLSPLADRLDRRLPKAWAGLVALFEPDGTLPPFGDTPGHPDRARWMQRAAASHARPWMVDPAAGRRHAGWFAEAGAARPGTLIVRRADEGAGWSAFTTDFSPRVQPQDHRDCTSFTFATGGLRWITETGGSQTEMRGPPGQDLAAAQAHNVAIPDGREPTAGLGIARPPVRLGDATVHRIDTTVHGPDYRHVRAFVVLDELAGLIVLDRFLTEDRPLGVAGGLHFDPAVTVALDPASRVIGLQGGRRLQIVPFAIAGRIADCAVQRSSAESLAGAGAADPGGRPGAVLRYALSGRGCVAGGVLIAGTSDGERRLRVLVEDAAFRRSVLA